MATACKVKFMRGRHGVDAVLVHKRGGFSINYLTLGHRPTLANMRSAKKSLMRGCAELVKLHSRQTRRR
jgi:hypothetical protein